MKDVAIVILNWNGRQFLEDFLPSVTTHSDDATIVVADNGSTDDSISFLEHNYPSIELIRHEVNHGFCDGYNKALEQLKEYKYYVLLNSDVEVTPGWLSPLIQLLEENDKIAACQPKIKSFNERDMFEHAGAAGGFIDKLGYIFCRGRIFTHLEKDEGQYNDLCEIFWATGACLTIRSKVYHEMGGLDSSFFAHMEEIDLCWRIKNHGHSIYYCGTSEVYHVGGGTLHKSNPRKTFLNFRNGLVLLFKNLPKRQFLPILLFRMILDGVAFIDFIAVGYPRDAWAIFRAHVSFYKNITIWLRGRRKAQKEIIKTNHKEIYAGSIVWRHFILKMKSFKDLNF